MKQYLSVFLTLVILGVLACGGYAYYHRYMRPMRIAIVADFDSSWLAYRDAAEGTNFAIHRYKTDQIENAPFDKYDLVMFNGMGWLPTEKQLKHVQSAASLGTYIHVSAATRESTANLNNLPEEVSKTFGKYSSAGGKENLHNALKYLARELKGYAAEIPDPKPRPRNGYFHLDGKLYENIEEYDAYIDATYPGLRKDAPRIVLTGAFVNLYDDLERGAVDLIGQKLVENGCRVYALMGGMGGMGGGASQGISLKDRIDACKPDALIFFPMGRLLPNNEAIAYLKERNIPCFNAINIVETKNEWLNEAMAMSGGYTSQTIVMPELDGIIEPTAVAAIDTNEEGLALRAPLTERIDMLVRRINRWMLLRRKPNSEKKVAIVYYKAPGHSPLGAAGIETIDSLYNVLCRMRDEGYDLGERMPASSAELAELIQNEGPVLGSWAKGTWEQFLENGNPEYVDAKDYARWLQKQLPKQNLDSLIQVWGNVPGKQNVAQKDGDACLVIPRVRLGNIVLMPQPGVAVISDDATEASSPKVATVPGGDVMPKTGGASSNNIQVRDGVGVKTDEISAVHGTDQPPPHSYLGTYLWIRNGFQADAMIHFGTHGSLEFTKGKSMVLSDSCWPTILVGDLPHIYPYIVDNIDEGMIAKRRSSAVLITHMTPPFTKAEAYGELNFLADKIHDFKMVEGDALRREYLVSITDMVRKSDMFKEIGYRENPPEDALLTEKDIEKLDEYIEHLSDENITEGLHVIGRPWEEHQIVDTVIAMLGDKAPQRIEEIRKSGKVSDLPKGTREALKYFVQEVINGNIVHDSTETKKEETPVRRHPQGNGGPSHGMMPSDMASSMPPGGGHPPRIPRNGDAMSGGHPMGAGGHPGGAMPGGGMPGNGMQGMMTRAPSQWGDVTGAPKKQQESDDPYIALIESIQLNAKNLKNCTPNELEGFLTALSGGYVEASTGGDVIVNPAVAPTGRNMGSINLDQTPTVESYRIGVMLSEDILANYRTQNPGQWPRKVACTLWGGEYNRTRGVLLAQCLYLMGLKPKWDSRQIVSEVEVIPSEELGRPRIDIVAQTSGHFRDSGMSRIELLDKAVRLVAELPDEKYPNYIKENSLMSEDQLKRQGIAPADARKYSTARIFGSPNNNGYGTGAQGAIDAAEQTEVGQLADRYISGMSGVYRNGKIWGVPVEGLLESQLQGTELMIQSRSANTWGPLTLDHVYEFSGLALAIREKTGTDPGLWFSDMRNPTKPRAMTASQAIREEARASLWNPKYIAGLQKEGAGAAANMVEPMRNLRGWNVVQESSVDPMLWDEMNAVYIEDKHGLEMKNYFENKNPYALQDMTAVMLDVVRKGMWKPDEKVVQNLAKLHVEMVEKHGAGCSADTCSDAKLHAFLGDVLGGLPESYESSLRLVLETKGTPLPEVEGMRLEEKIEQLLKRDTALLESAPLFVSIILVAMVAMLGIGFFRKSVYSNIHAL